MFIHRPGSLAVQREFYDIPVGDPGKTLCNTAAAQVHAIYLFFQNKRPFPPHIYITPSSPK